MTLPKSYQDSQRRIVEHCVEGIGTDPERVRAYVEAMTELQMRAERLWNIMADDFTDEDNPRCWSDWPNIRPRFWRALTDLDAWFMNPDSKPRFDANDKPCA